VSAESRDAATRRPAAAASDALPDPASDSAGRREAERSRVRELIDFQEGRIDVPVLDDAAIADVLSSARRIAVIGASPHRGRASNGVLRYLAAAGYDVIPVNPTESTIEGRTCYPTLADAAAAEGAIDIVDVFRRSELCPAHAAEAVAVGARCLWLQLGIVSLEAGRIAHAGGLAVVMDRCTQIEHARLRR
jgi:predicted CoA-binding protein